MKVWLEFKNNLNHFQNGSIIPKKYQKIRLSNFKNKLNKHIILKKTCISKLETKAKRLSHKINLSNLKKSKRIQKVN